jgi:hypothetical protein
MPNLVMMRGTLINRAHPEPVGDGGGGIGGEVSVQLRWRVDGAKLTWKLIILQSLATTLEN